MMRVVHDFDYKSPYAYLAQGETFRLASEIGLVVDWVSRGRHAHRAGGFEKKDLLAA
jgi:2-hydroxychromene-2-carboxylate isomerase